MRANVKPLTHWIIYKGYTVRFRKRTAESVLGTLTTPAGPIDFEYIAGERVIRLPNETIQINEYGWETTDGPI